MSRGARVLLAAFLAGLLLLACLAWPRFLLQMVVLPVATVLWLALRLFVLSIDQQVYWWGTVALASFVMIAVLLRGASSRPFSLPAVAAPPGDPTRRWRDSIRLNVTMEPLRDTFRRDLAWMLTSLYASQRPGFAKFQIREAMLRREIALPDPVYEFLFTDTRPREPPPPFLSGPRAWVRHTAQAAARGLRSAARGKRVMADYLESISVVLAFMETSLEMTHEHEPDP